jgi:DNA-3-methyladenine glycosylase II
MPMKSRVLKVKQTLELVPTAPFSFDATLHKPDHFHAADTKWEPGTRWQTMLWQGKPLGLRFENQGTVARPRIALSIWSARQLGSDFLSRLADEIIYRYNLQLDLTEFYQRFQSHPTLGPVLRKWRGMRPLNYSSLYEYALGTTASSSPLSCKTPPFDAQST